MFNSQSDSECLEFINKFSLLGNTDGFDCPKISALLYRLFLNKFEFQINQAENEIISIYHNRVFNLIQAMYDLTQDQIEGVFRLLDKTDPCLVDIVIMSWLLPRPTEQTSQDMRIKNYKSNILAYSGMLSRLINFYPIRNFCVETLSKTNYVPVHCIDLLWYYMNGLTIEFNFCNDYARDYLKITVNDDQSITMGLHMEHIFRLGLGSVINVNDTLNRGPFRNYLKQFLVNEELIESILASPYSGSKNFVRQKNLIMNNLSTYFDLVELTKNKLI